MLEPGAEMETTPLAALPMEAAVNELPAEAFAEEESMKQLSKKDLERWENNQWKHLCEWKN